MESLTASSAIMQMMQLGRASIWSFPLKSAHHARNMSNAARGPRTPNAQPLNGTGYGSDDTLYGTAAQEPACSIGIATQCRSWQHSPSRRLWRRRNCVAINLRGAD